MSTSPKQSGSVSPPPSPRRLPPHRGSSHHVPTTPSRLRETVAAEPDLSFPERRNDDISGPPALPLLGGQTISAEPKSISSPSTSSFGAVVGMTEPSQREADARTRLLEDYHKGPACGLKNCNHGTFSPHIRAQDSISSNVSSLDGFGGRNGDNIHDENAETQDRTRSWIGDTFADGLFGGFRRSTSMNTAKWLAPKHGNRNRRTL